MVATLLRQWKPVWRTLALFLRRNQKRAGSGAGRDFTRSFGWIKTLSAFTEPSVRIPENRIGAVCAIAGAMLLLTGTWLHPMPTDPNDAAQAFAVYAGDRLWVASHLAQLVGIALALAALLILARQLETGGAAVWARLASAGTVASLALAAALQAVDGIALRAMVENWAVAAQKENALQSAFAVRQVEIGLAGMLSLVFGATATLFGIALLGGLTYARWIGALAIVGGASTVLSGIVMAFSGFSDLEMAISMPASVVLVVWTLIVGVQMWRRE